MIRNSIGVVTGVVLSFVLNFVGSRLVWFLIIGNVERSENKDAIVRWMLWQTFGLLPAVATAVAAFVGFVVRRSAW